MPRMHFTTKNYFSDLREQLHTLLQYRYRVCAQETSDCLPLFQQFCDRFRRDLGKLITSFHWKKTLDSGQDEKMEKF